MSQYSNIAKSYESSTNLAYRKYCEAWTFKKLWGEISGLKVIDVACGAGFVTQVLSECNPDYIFSLDIEPAMVEIAKDIKYSIDNIDFVCADIKTLNHFESYDLAVSAYCLNEAETELELLTFLNPIFKSLKNGGSAIFEFDNAIESSKYNWDKMGYPVYEILPSVNDIVRYKLAVKTLNGLIEIECSYFSESQLKEALMKSGFCNIQFFDIEVSKEGFINMGKKYWNELSKTPLTKFVKAMKLM